jgi:hypothetical protein
VDGSVKVGEGDRGGLERLVRYMARPAVSFERVSYDEHTGEVTVRSAKKQDGVRPVVARYQVLTFLALLVLHVPPSGMHMVRYYGWYSSRGRAARKVRLGLARVEAGQGDGQVPGALNTAASPTAAERRLRWAQLIKSVFETDPLECGHCGGQMKFVAVTTSSQPTVIDRLLTHLGLDSEDPTARQTGPPLWLQIAQAQSHLEAYPESDPEWDGCRDDFADDVLDQRHACVDDAYHDQSSWG